MQDIERLIEKINRLSRSTLIANLDTQCVHGTPEQFARLAHAASALSAVAGKLENITTVHHGRAVENGTLI